MTRTVGWLVLWYNMHCETLHDGKAKLGGKAQQVTEAVWSKFTRIMGQRRLVRPDETIIVGVSGGPDSLCLLHLLRRLRDEKHLAIRLVAAHLDHGIRPESGDDAKFVEKIAADWDIPSEMGCADVPAMAREPGLSLEEAARIARYRFLLETAMGRGATTVAVGHNADDQVESVLMHWLRGSGLAGLRGMLPQSLLSEMRLGQDFPELENDIRLIRPLLEFTREEIEAYCRQHGLQPRFDQSNLDTTLFRNRLRHELIPYLESYNPNIKSVLVRSAGVLAHDYDYCHSKMLTTWEMAVRELGDGVLEFDRTRWQGVHPSLQAGLLREAIRRLRWTLRNINWIHIENALQLLRAGQVGQKVTLPQGLMLTIGYESFWIADEEARLPMLRYPALSSDIAPVLVPGETPIGEGVWLLKTELVERETEGAIWERNESPWRAYLDAEKLDLTDIRLRIRLPRDRFCPLGMGGKSKEVREFMIGVKLPKGARERYPLVVAGDQIVWIPGLRLDERVKVRLETTRVLVMTMRTRKVGETQ